MFEIKITLSPENKCKIVGNFSGKELTRGENSFKSQVNEIEISTALDLKDKEPNLYNLFETISGHSQLMRVKSENISLTDKYEFFRFLPIKRNNIVK